MTRLADDSVQWCRERKAKVSYETLEEAWLGVFYTFITSGQRNAAVRTYAVYHVTWLPTGRS